METLEELLERKAAYLAAEKAALKSQSVSTGQFGVVRANLKEIRDELNRINADIATIQSAASGGSTNIARF
ncbi:MAG: hypothetical protein HQM10_26575 [Candidatus Riflebacteria bacterium]|nr:hypothetical protein [Candidatus Riflebacteria bacterium]